MLPALVALALLSGACSSSSGGARAPSTSSAPTEAVGGPTTSDPRASARPPGPGVPVAPIGGAGGAPGDRPEEMSQWAADHDLTVEWYSGGATLTAAFRGLDLGQLPPLCLTTAIESAPTRAAEGMTIAPTGDGGCNGAAGIVGSIQTCLDLAVYPTAIAIAGAGRLVANVQQWDAGRLVTDLSGVVALDAIPPPFDRTALGC